MPSHETDYMLIGSSGPETGGASTGAYKENFLRRIARLIKKLSEEEEKKHFHEQSKQWANKALSPDKNQRRIAQEEAKASKYTFQETDDRARDLRQAMEIAQEAVKISRDQKTDATWLEMDKIQGSQAVEFASVIASLPQEVLEDPNILYREAMRAYRGMRWTEATQQDTKEMKILLDRVLSRAANLYVVQGRDENTERLWKKMDEGFDLYKTRKITVTTDTDKHLDRWLRNQQGILDRQAGLYVNDPRAEKQALNAMSRDLAQGRLQLPERGSNKVNTFWIDLDESPSAIAILNNINTRIVDLDLMVTGGRAHKGAAAGTSRDRRGGADNTTEYAVLDQLREANGAINKEELLERITSPTLRHIAERIIAEGVTNKDREQLRQQLERFKLDGILDQEVRLAAAAANLESDDPRISLLAQDQENITRDLNTYLTQQSLAEGKHIEGGYWRRAENKADYDKMLNFSVNDVNFTEEGPTKRKFQELDEIFFKILSKADQDPRATFRENFNLYDEQDLDLFFKLLRYRMEQLPVLTADNRQQVFERYSALRGLKESYHNYRFISHTGGLDQLVKFSATYQSEDAEFMFRNVEYVHLAMHAQEAVLTRLIADHDGYALPELFGRDPRVISEFEQGSKDLLRQMLEVNVLDENGQPKQIPDWQVNLAHDFARGFSIVSLLLPEKISNAKPPETFDSAYMNDIVSQMDSFRYLVLRYNIGAPGTAALYYTATGDEEGFMSALAKGKDFGPNQLMSAMDAKMDDPEYGERIRDFVSLFQSSSVFSTPDTGWRVEKWSKGWSSDEYKRRGVALRLAALKGEVQKEKKGYMEQQLGNKTKAERNKWWEEHAHAIEHDIEHEVAHRSEHILEEAIKRTPLVFARNWTSETGEYKQGRRWFQRRMDLLQEVLGQEALSGVRSQGINTYWDVYNNNPATRGGDRLPGKSQLAVDKAWDTIRGDIARVENAVDIVQQYVIQRGDNHIEDQHFDVIKDERTRHQAKEYVKLIIEAAEGQYGPNHHGSFVKKLAEDIGKGKQRRLLTTIDVPFEKFNYSQSGSNQFKRRIEDCMYTHQATMGTGEYLGRFGDHFDKVKMAELFREKVTTPMKAVDAGIAQKIGYYIAGKATLGFYAEAGWASYSGIIGDTLPFLLPREAQTSLAKKVYGSTAEAWGPNDRYEWIHDIEGMGILYPGKVGDFDHGAADHKFSAHNLMHETHSGMGPIAMEIGVYLAMGASAFVGLNALWSAITTADDAVSTPKSGGGGHH